jgi:hypothetical protein
MRLTYREYSLLLCRILRIAVHNSVRDTLVQLHKRVV